MPRLSRRELLASGALAGATALSPGWLRAALAAPVRAGAGPYGKLRPADANGLMLPPGFKSRQIARALRAVPGTDYLLPVFPDGQATFRTRDGGWILVTNSESLSVTGAGSSAIRFGPGGEIRSAYRILGGTNVNCAGGPTPWGTWLSCEETDSGMVWEADPAGVLAAEPRPALGLFEHEAVAVDAVGGRLYLTEDEGAGGFYRFTPWRYPDLTSGLLEVAVVQPGGAVRWVEVPDPSTAETGIPTREQVPGMTRFRGGEGIWYARGLTYFTTKGDKRVWAYDTVAERIGVLFDRTEAMDSSLDAVDNVTVTSAGEIFVCEDGGNMEIGLIDGGRTVSPFLRFTGDEHQRSEVCGVVFDPSGRRLYCTSQRAFPPLGNSPGPGAIYEITGPFRAAAAGIPDDFVFGPPAGEVRPNGPLNPGADTRAPSVRVQVPRRVRRSRLARRGLPVRIRSAEAVTVSFRFLSHDLRRRPGKGGSSARPVALTLAKGNLRIERDIQRAARLRLALPPRGRKRMRRRRRAFKARLIVSARDAAGNRTVIVRRIRVGRVRRP